MAAVSTVTPEYKGNKGAFTLPLKHRYGAKRCVATAPNAHILPSHPGGATQGFAP